MEFQKSKKIEKIYWMSAPKNIFFFFCFDIFLYLPEPGIKQYLISNR